MARFLTSRQLRVYVGGAVTMRAEGPRWPLHYFAVRDPSAVKVKPLEKPSLPNGFRHVKLVFQLDRPVPEPDAAVIPPCRDDTASPAFLLTIGLRATKEELFFERVVTDHADQTWGDVYRRLSELGCGDGADYL
ncbi:MAG: hypothetical protein H7Y88_11980 [Phycisphaerales bacterium]|nr:hypothetical protein [Phycisphaerales bacterium]